MTNQARPPLRRRDDDGVEIIPIARGRRTLWLVGIAIALPIVATLVAVAVIRATPASRAAGGPRPSNDADAATAARPDANAPPAAPHPRPAPAASGTVPRVVPRRIAATEPAAPVPPGTTPVPEPQKPR